MVRRTCAWDGRSSGGSGFRTPSSNVALITCCIVVPCKSPSSIILALSQIWEVEVRTDAMPLKTKRWNDPREPDDGFRLLICQYRPRGVARKDETWDGWCTELAPTRELHGDFYGKNGPPITWEEYRTR